MSVVEFAVRLYFLLASIVGIILISSPDKLNYVAVPHVSVNQDASVHITSADGALCSENVVSCPAVASVARQSKFSGNPRLLSVFVNEQEYQLALSDDEPSYLQDKALEFCTEQRAALKATAAVLRSGCMSSVQEYLQQAVRDEDLLPLHLEDLLPRRPDTRVQFEQGRFIVKHEDTFYVRVALADGRDFYTSFPALQAAAPAEVALGFCLQHAAALGFARRAELLQDCVPTIRDFLAAEIAKFHSLQAAESAPSPSPQAAEAAETNGEASVVDANTPQVDETASVAEVLAEDAAVVQQAGASPAFPVAIGEALLDFPLPGDGDDSLFDHALLFCEAHWETRLRPLFAALAQVGGDGEPLEGAVQDAQGCAQHVLQQLSVHRHK